MNGSLCLAQPGWVVSDEGHEGEVRSRPVLLWTMVEGTVVPVTYDPAGKLVPALGQVVIRYMPRRYADLVAELNWESEAPEEDPEDALNFNDILKQFEQKPNPTFGKAMRAPKKSV